MEFKPNKSWFDNLRLKEHWPIEKPILTLPARLTRWKGQEHLSSYANLKNRGLEFHGLIVGGAQK